MSQFSFQVLRVKDSASWLRRHEGYGEIMATETLVPGFTNKRLWIVLGALALAVMLANMETSIIATALPTITGQFNAFESFAWVGTAYIVTSAISTPLLGKLSDLYGRRLIFQSTMAVFLVGSILCGASQSMGQLIAARAFQGMGGGGIQALAFAILGDILPPRERGRYMGYFTLAFVGSSILGPLIGGIIIDQASWPWIFYINIPFIIVVAGICHFALKLPFKRRTAKLDFMGAGLLSLTIASLMIGLEEGRHGWTQQHVLILLVIAVLGLIAFIKVEQHAEEPMIPLRLFSNDVVRTCALLGMAAGAVIYGAGGFLSLYFQDSLLVSPTESGLRTLPQMLGVTIATFGIGRIISKTGRYKVFPIVGSSLSFLGLIGIAQISGSTSYLFLVMPMILLGFGTAAIFTTTSIASQNAVEFSDLGVATATVMFFRMLGGSFGLALFGTVLNSTIRSEIPKRIPTLVADNASTIIRSPEQIGKLPLVSKQAVVDSLAMGVSRIHWLCAGFMIIAFLLSLILRELPLRLRAGLSDAMESANS
jgi:EmrB/QacA subfamily drug resistance transporter